MEKARPSVLVKNVCTERHVTAEDMLTYLVSRLYNRAFLGAVSPARGAAPPQSVLSELAHAAAEAGRPWEVPPSMLTALDVILEAEQRADREWAEELQERIRQAPSPGSAEEVAQLDRVQRAGESLRLLIRHLAVQAENTGVSVAVLADEWGNNRSPE